MNKNIAIVCAVAFVVQCAAGFSMIASREKILKKGTRILMAVRPVDPYDPMRGRYVSLRPAIEDTGAAENTVKWVGERSRSRRLAVLGVDEQGFVKVESYETKRPEGKHYLSVLRRYGSTEWPIDRYYVREDLGPKADAYMAKVAREQTPAHKAYIAARVLDGEFVIEELYFDGMPFEEALKKGGAHA